MGVCHMGLSGGQIVAHGLGFYGLLFTACRGESRVRDHLSDVTLIGWAPGARHGKHADPCFLCQVVFVGARAERDGTAPGRPTDVGLPALDERVFVLGCLSWIERRGIGVERKSGSITSHG